MPRTAPKTELLSHYRAIGPAAIIAALICAQNKSLAASTPKAT